MIVDDRPHLSGQLVRAVPGGEILRHRVGILAEATDLLDDRLGFGATGVS